MSEQGTRNVQPSQTVTCLMEPWKAAERDPSLSEWLQLPLSAKKRPTCPECGSTHFGTVNPHGYLYVWVCHDEKGTGCRTRFRGKPDLYTLRGLLGALMGEELRLGTGAPSDVSQALSKALDLLEMVFGCDKGMDTSEWIDFCNEHLAFMHAQGRLEGVVDYA